MFSFLNITLVDILDIILVAAIIFYVFRLLRGSQAISIFIAIVALYALRLVASAFNMELMSGLLGAVLDVGMIALIVIFQPEIRRFLSRLGSGYTRNGSGMGWLKRLLGIGQPGESTETINEICKACEEMGEDKCGALIVIEKSQSLKYICETGDEIDAKVNKRLLMNLFFKNSPLHDGAVIIRGDRVASVRCTLPITESETPASFGMRHKAAIGISESSDAQVVVVSEETGRISVMRFGKTVHVENINDLKRLLQNA